MRCINCAFGPVPETGVGFDMGVSSAVEERSIAGEDDSSLLEEPENQPMMKMCFEMTNAFNVSRSVSKAPSRR